MISKVPNGFHQALVSATVFLAGITIGYLKVFVVDGSSGDWSFFAVISALGALCAMLVQVETLRRALRVDNDDPARFASTARMLMGSVWLLVASGLCLIAAHWWQPFQDWVNWFDLGKA